VEEVVVYRTVEGPEASRRPLADAVASGSVDAIVFTSGSTVRGLLALLPPDLAAAVRAVPACCIGEPTTAVAVAAGFSHILTASSPRVDAVADLVASTLPTGAIR
jgi:uroporphyrinogen-III synthase